MKASRTLRSLPSQKARTSEAWVVPLRRIPRETPGFNPASASLDRVPVRASGKAITFLASDICAIIMHMKIKIILVKAFTNDSNAGNPAGVILNADHLTVDQMQYIARTLNFSESVFVLKSDKADCRMRYFSPTKEVDYCAHATLAGAAVLRTMMAVETHETNAGVFKITVDKQSDLITLWQQKPTFGALIESAQLAPLLGVTTHDINPNMPCQIVSTGVPKLMIPMQSLQSLQAIQPDFEGIKQFCVSIGARGFYPFSTETIFQDSHFHARQFNPLAGIDEDPITGIAAGALGAYWMHHRRDNVTPYIVEQGYNMGKFGKVYVTASSDTEQPVMIHGHSVIVGETELSI